MAGLMPDANPAAATRDTQLDTPPSTPGVAETTSQDPPAMSPDQAQLLQLYGGYLQHTQRDGAKMTEEEHKETFGEFVAAMTEQQRLLQSRQVEDELQKKKGNGKDMVSTLGTATESSAGGASTEMSEQTQTEGETKGSTDVSTVPENDGKFAEYKASEKAQGYGKAKAAKEVVSKDTIQPGTEEAGDKEAEVDTQQGLRQALAQQLAKPNREIPHARAAGTFPTADTQDRSAQTQDTLSPARPQVHFPPTAASSAPPHSEQVQSGDTANPLAQSDITINPPGQTQTNDTTPSAAAAPSAMDLKKFQRQLRRHRKRADEQSATITRLTQENQGLTNHLQNWEAQFTAMRTTQDEAIARQSEMLSGLTSTVNELKALTEGQARKIDEQAEEIRGLKKRQGEEGTAAMSGQTSAGEISRTFDAPQITHSQARPASYQNPVDPRMMSATTTNDMPSSIYGTANTHSRVHPTFSGEPPSRLWGQAQPRSHAFSSGHPLTMLLSDSQSWGTSAARRRANPALRHLPAGTYTRQYHESSHEFLSTDREGATAALTEKLNHRLTEMLSKGGIDDGSLVSLTGSVTLPDGAVVTGTIKHQAPTRSSAWA